LTLSTNIWIVIIKKHRVHREHVALNINPGKLFQRTGQGSEYNMTGSHSLNKYY